MNAAELRRYTEICKFLEQLYPELPSDLIERQAIIIFEDERRKKEAVSC